MDGVVGKSNFQHHRNFDMGKLAWRWGGIQRYRDNRDGQSDGEAHRDNRIMEVDCSIGSLYLRDPRADGAYLII